MKTLKMTLNDAFRLRKKLNEAAETLRDQVKYADYYVDAETLESVQKKFDMGSFDETVDTLVELYQQLANLSNSINAANVVAQPCMVELKQINDSINLYTSIHSMSNKGNISKTFNTVTGAYDLLVKVAIGKQNPRESLSLLRAQKARVESQLAKINATEKVTVQLEDRWCTTYYAPNATVVETKS